jgi:hypothetical protein
LNRRARAAFRAAAEDAIAHLQCSGPGIVHRTLAALHGQYFDPPTDSRWVSWDSVPGRGGKQMRGAPIGRPGRDDVRWQSGDLCRHKIEGTGRDLAAVVWGTAVELAKADVEAV